jgi:hypothetical protein
MSNMNSALSTWQLVIMAVVPLTALVGWIVTIFIVAREPRRPYVAAAAPAAPAAPAASAGAAASGTAVPAIARASETEPRTKEPVAA